MKCKHQLLASGHWFNNSLNHVPGIRASELCLKQLDEQITQFLTCVPNALTCLKNHTKFYCV